ncbi:MAG: hypothetical protein QOI01_2324 [Mycobacterium sp.]|jgi:hypothetical protein|nr:hypothetical protein [Mycobacterium sp.]
MNLRHYPPARTIHDVGCPDAPPGQIVFRASSLLPAYPNAVPHTCFTRDTVLDNRDVVAEAVEYEPHPYRPSGATQPDAGYGPCAEPAVAPTRTGRNRLIRLASTRRPGSNHERTGSL